MWYLGKKSFIIYKSSQPQYTIFPGTPKYCEIFQDDLSRQGTTSSELPKTRHHFSLSFSSDKDLNLSWAGISLLSFTNLPRPFNTLLHFQDILRLHRTGAFQKSGILEPMPTTYVSVNVPICQS